MAQQLFSITYSLTQRDIDQAVRLSKLYYTDLIQKLVKPYGPTSSLCSSQVEIEVRAYLEEALTGFHGLCVEALVAKEVSTNDVVGFAIALSAPGSTDCGLNYAAVRKDFRRQGVLRVMLESIKSKYSFIGLSCHPDKVPYYEALGFRADGTVFVQVSMSWGEDKPHPMMNTFDMGRSDELQMCTQSFLKLHGAKAEAIMQNLGDVQIKRMEDVKAYYQRRNDGLSHEHAMAYESPRVF